MRHPCFTTPTTFLAVEGLTVSFDGFKAVDDLSFYVDKDEIFVIIGPNGAGKTTVLDLICGRTKATGGSVRFKGRETAGHARGPDRPCRRRAEVPEPVDLRGPHRLREPRAQLPTGYIVFGSLAFKRSAEVIVTRIEETADTIFLADHARRQGGAALATARSSGSRSGCC